MVAWNSVFFYSLACWTIQVQENDNKEKNFHMQIVHVTRVWFQEKPIQMTEKKNRKTQVKLPFKPNTSRISKTQVHKYTLELLLLYNKQ